MSEGAGLLHLQTLFLVGEALGQVGVFEGVPDLPERDHIVERRHFFERFIVVSAVLLVELPLLPQHPRTPQTQLLRRHRPEILQILRNSCQLRLLFAHLFNNKPTLSGCSSHQP